MTLAEKKVARAIKRLEEKTRAERKKAELLKKGRLLDASRKAADVAGVSAQVGRVPNKPRTKKRRGKK